MGPRLFRRGNVVETLKRYQLNQLQWGHVFSDVETKRQAERLIGNMGLQWGHVFSDVETANAIVTVIYDGTLQWGHVFSDVETAG